MRKIDELKLKLKGMAEDIRKTNVELKQLQKQGGCGSTLMFRLYRMRYECRHHHIAYCELRGLERDRIEKPREYNKANERAVESIKLIYAWELPEVKVAG